MAGVQIIGTASGYFGGARGARGAPREGQRQWDREEVGPSFRLINFCFGAGAVQVQVGAATLACLLNITSGLPL